MSHSRAVDAALTACVTALALILGACGQRGPLYIPGQPGDPYFDRQQRGTAPAPSGAQGTQGTQGNTGAPDSTKPAPRRDGEGKDGR